jgi:hypothetical protein
MPARFTDRSLPLLGLVPLLAALAFTGRGRAEPAKGAPALAKEEEERMRKMVREEFKGKEAEALKEAYILMKAANHDYGGHCGKAQHEVEEACKILDKDILKNGSVQQKLKAIQEDREAAAAKSLSKGDAAVHEAQLFSDAQVLKAGVMLQEVAAAVAANKQKGALKHVEQAIKEVEIALKTR